MIGWHGITEKNGKFGELIINYEKKLPTLHPVIFLIIFMFGYI